MIYEKSCGAIQFRVIDNEVQYLILKSLEPNSYWGFAKGHMESLETEEETCIREVFEETGIKIEIENDFRMVDKYKISEDAEKEVVIYLANTKGQSVTIQQEEIMDYKWCNYNTAINLLTFESSRNMLDKANKILMKFK
jgi:tRNA nucleotidyltransferase (CCA-adding enzyme)